MQLAFFNARASLFLKATNYLVIFWVTSSEHHCLHDRIFIDQSASAEVRLCFFTFLLP